MYTNCYPSLTFLILGLFAPIPPLMEPLAQQEGNSLKVDCIFLNKHIPVVSGITQVLVSLTTNMQGDNITALYTHRDLAILLHTHQGTKVRQT